MLSQSGRDRPRADCVNRDATGGIGHRHLAGQADDAMFGGDVGGTTTSPLSPATDAMFTIRP